MTGSVGELLVGDQADDATTAHMQRISELTDEFRGTTDPVRRMEIEDECLGLAYQVASIGVQRAMDAEIE